MLREIRRKLAEDPLLKIGIVAMTLAIAFAGVTALIVFLENPQLAVAARSPGESGGGPLAGLNPDQDPSTEGDSSSSGPDQGSVSRQGDSSFGGSSRSGDQNRQVLPLDETNFPLPTDEQLREARHTRHYHLPPGAIMSLTVNPIGLKNVPVMNSNTKRALDQGVIHLPDTSLPWSQTPERNVYLAGHRLGWPGTGSHLVFYHLNQLERGDRITLRDRQGTRYNYRVLETFAVEPDEDWVTGIVRGRDLLTLQTCTPIPTFQYRLIVRAERI